MSSEIDSLIKLLEVAEGILLYRIIIFFSFAL